MVMGIAGRTYHLPSTINHLDQKRGNWSPGHPRVFKLQLDQTERDALLYILKNLAQTSLIGLLPIKGKLKEKGVQLDHLHPLAFFIGIMSDPVLKNYFNQLRNKNNRAWTEFSNGAINSFKEEKRGHNITDGQIDTFCKILGQDTHYIRHLIHVDKWHELLSKV